MVTRQGFIHPATNTNIATLRANSAKSLHGVVESFNSARVATPTPQTTAKQTRLAGDIDDLHDGGTLIARNCAHIACISGRESRAHRAHWGASDRAVLLSGTKCEK